MMINLVLKKKVKEMKDEVINLRSIILSQQAIGPALYNLLQRGMVEQNIIDIHNLIENINNNTDISNKKENTKNNISRSEYWKSFIDTLKIYGDIHVAIREQQSIYEKMKKEFNNLYEQKQEISKYIQTTIYFINILNNQISYYKGRLDSIKNLNKRIDLPSIFLQPFIFIAFENKVKDKKDNNNKDNNKLSKTEL